MRSVTTWTILYGHYYKNLSKTNLHHFFKHFFQLNCIKEIESIVRQTDLSSKTFPSVTVFQITLINLVVQITLTVHGCIGDSLRHAVAELESMETSYQNENSFNEINFKDNSPFEAVSTYLC